MRYSKYLLGLGIVFLWGATAQALYINEGIHEMQWGSSTSNYDHLVEVHQKDLAKFYIKGNTRYLAADQKVARVSYGFYRDQLYAAFIKLQFVEQFSKLADTFSEKLRGTRNGSSRSPH